MTTVAIQELSQSRNLLNSISEQKASEVYKKLSFYFKEWSNLMLKSEIYHPFSDFKKIKIDFTLISDILSIHYALIMPKLKLPVTISCVALCFLNNE